MYSVAKIEGESEQCENCKIEKGTKNSGAEALR
jgi:hypothetical protein